MAGLKTLDQLFLTSLVNTPMAPIVGAFFIVGTMRIFQNWAKILGQLSIPILLSILALR